MDSLPIEVQYIIGDFIIPRVLCEHCPKDYIEKHTILSEITPMRMYVDQCDACRKKRDVEILKESFSNLLDKFMVSPLYMNTYHYDKSLMVTNNEFMNITQDIVNERFGEDFIAFHHCCDGSGIMLHTDSDSD